MRKLTSLLLAAVLLLSCTVTAFAAEDDPVEIGVYAKTEYSIDGEYTAPVENGSASVTTPDGTVTITNAPAGAVTFVVIPMEGEALTWIAGCVEDNTVAAYDIHFRDADGNRINANAVKVSIAVSGTELSVSSVTTSGADKTLISELTGGKVSFTTDGGHYYVIAEMQTEDDHDTKVEVEDFGAEDISDELKNAGYDTVEKIEAQLLTKVTALNSGIVKDDTVMYDVVLMYSTDGGKTWQVADEEHFPEDGKLLVSLPVPAGTDPIKHDYYVVHMFSKTAFGKVAGDVEYPAVTERDNHIEFYVTGLSPILVGWVEAGSTDPVEEHKVTIEKTSGGKVEISDDTPVTGQTVTITAKPNNGKVVDKVIVTDENGKAVKIKDNGDGTYSFEQPDGDVTVKVTFKNKPSSGDTPKTGDNSNIWLWLILLIISATMLIYMGSKMRKRSVE